MIRLIHVSLPAKALVLLISETALLSGCYLAASYWTQTLDMDLYLNYDGGLLQIASVVVMIQVGLYLQLLYETLLPRSRLLLIQQLCMVLGFAFLAQALSGYAGWMIQLPKWTMIDGSLLVLLLVPLWRMIYWALVSRAAAPRRLLFLGSSPIMEDLAATLSRHPDLGLSAIGYLDTESSTTSPIPQLGRIEDIDEVILAQRPDRLVTTLRGGRDRLPMRFLFDLLVSGIQVEEAGALYETLTGRISAHDLHPSHLIFSFSFEPGPAHLAVKKVYSMILAVVLTIAVLPLFVIAALLIKASSGGPILLRQKRIGLRGKPFELYRFRSDPSTAAGRCLRRFHLDGLPQLFNIVRGEMSIIGPRPERPEFAQILEAQVPFYRQRHSILPGITGWEQINMHGLGEMENAVTKLEYDLYYIKNMSPALDAYVLLHSLDLR